MASLPSSLNIVIACQIALPPLDILTSFSLKLAYVGIVPLGYHTSYPRASFMPRQRKSGAMGAKSGEKSQWSEKESQGCPEIRSVPVATRRIGFLYIPCPGRIEADFSFE